MADQDIINIDENKPNQQTMYLNPPPGYGYPAYPNPAYPGYGYPGMMPPPMGYDGQLDKTGAIMVILYFIFIFVLNQRIVTQLDSNIRAKI